MLTDLFENWTNGSWLNEYRDTNTYDNNGNILTELHEDMSGVYRSTYTYDNMDNLLTYLFESGSAINTLGNVWRDTYTYSTENYGRIISDILEQWLNDKWVNSNLLISNYDNNNKALTHINKQWTFGVWSNEWKDTCIYDSRGFLSTVLDYNWLAGWVLGGRETLTNDNYGDVLIDFWENWSNGKWINNNRLTNTFDNNRNLLTQISELWADSVWEKQYSFGYIYDNFGNSIHGETDQNLHTQWGMVPLEMFYNFRNNHLNFAVNSVDIQYSLITGINSEEVNVKSFSLSQNYPNPFNPTTTIKYSIANEGPVKLSVYNVLGSKISDLVNGNKPAGNYSVEFNAKDLSSGMYLYKLESGNYTAVKKLLLLK